MESGQHDNLVPSDKNFDAETWQRSLEISAPAGMPSPEELARPVSEYSASDRPAPDYPGPDYPGPEIIASAPENTPESASGNNPENTPGGAFGNVQEAPGATAEFGQITAVGAPFGAPVSTSVNSAASPNYNPVNIKTTGDKLEKSSIAEVDSAISELNQTGNLSNFYDEIRGEQGMMSANLHNSFGRKIGADNMGGMGAPQGGRP